MHSQDTDPGELPHSEKVDLIEDIQQLHSEGGRNCTGTKSEDNRLMNESMVQKVLSRELEQRNASTASGALI